MSDYWKKVIWKPTGFAGTCTCRLTVFGNNRNNTALVMMHFMTLHLLLQNPACNVVLSRPVQRKGGGGGWWVQSSQPPPPPFWSENNFVLFLNQITGKPHTLLETCKDFFPCQLRRWGGACPLGSEEWGQRTPLFCFFTPPPPHFKKA